MSSDKLERESDSSAALTEVEFALLLARTIDLVNKDPEHLRHVVYDLARYKLGEQLEQTGSDQQTAETKHTLEAAIRSVEAFSRRSDQIALPSPARSTAVEPQIVAPASPPISWSPAHELRELDRDERPLKTYRRRKGWTWIAGCVGLIAVIVAGIAVARLMQARHKSAQEMRAAAEAPAPAIAPPAKSQEINVPPPKPAPLLPTNFGVFALNDDKLYELNQLPSRAQDVRIALTPTIAPSTAQTIPNGRMSFVVYRREATSSIPERAEVRIIGRVRRAISYNAAGKPVEQPDDGWYLRNIVIPYRVAPIAENPEMYRVQPEKDDTPLAPGRYGLVLKGQVYDFTVDGTVTDPRQCLARLTATNGTFVSECDKL